MLAHFDLILRDPVLRLSAIASLMFGCFAASIGPYQSLIAVREFQMSNGAYAAVLIGALVVAVLTAIGVGILTDQRPSRRRMAIVATLANLVAALLVWLLPSKTSFVVAHVALIPLGGTVFGQILALARLASQSLPLQDRPGVLAIVRAAMAVPFVVLLPLWGIAADHGLSLVHIYLGLAGFSVLQLVLILRNWPPDATAPWVEVKSGLGFRAALGEMLAPPVFLRVQLFGALQAGGALAGILVGLAMAGAGRPTGEVGLFFAAFVAVEVVVTLMVGTLTRFASRLTLIATGTVMYAVFLALVPVWAGSPLLWLLIVPAGAGGALIYTLAITYLADLLGARAGAGASLLALQRIGQDSVSAGSFWIGSALGGYPLAGVLGAALTVAAVGGVIALDRRRP